MNNRYDNVAALLKSMDLPATQKKRQLDYIRDRQLSRLLTVMRVKKNMSQKQAAEKLGWSQGRVSKLEMKADRQISVGDLLDYSAALDIDLSLVFRNFSKSFRTKCGTKRNRRSVGRSVTDKVCAPQALYTSSHT